MLRRSEGCGGLGRLFGSLCIGVWLCLACRTRLCWWIWIWGWDHYGLAAYIYSKAIYVLSYYSTLLWLLVIHVGCMLRFIMQILAKQRFAHIGLETLVHANNWIYKGFGVSRESCPSHGSFRGESIHEYRSMDICRAH
jgi:hypothetical protein